METKIVYTCEICGVEQMQDSAKSPRLSVVYNLGAEVEVHLVAIADYSKYIYSGSFAVLCDECKLKLLKYALAVMED